jgi:hypothetical protein
MLAVLPELDRCQAGLENSLASRIQILAVSFWLKHNKGSSTPVGGLPEEEKQARVVFGFHVIA